MKVYLCALAKNEHLYINEWVEHYLKIGVDKIFIYDNDDKGTKYIGDFIDKNYLQRVKIINARGIHFDNMQGKFYTNFYKVEKDNFDWCIFCDIDEFLMGIQNIKAFLSQQKFDIYKQIRVKWKLFGDDDLIERDMTQKVVDTFHNEITYSMNRDLTKQIKLENQGKAIVKGHQNCIVFNSVHFADSDKKILPSCLPSGNICFSGVQIKEDYSHEKVFLNHYMTKSLSEFIKQKSKRTDAVFGNRTLDMNYYWRINKKTEEKIRYLQDLGLE